MPASRKLGRDTAAELAAGASRLIVAKGRKVREWRGADLGDAWVAPGFDASAWSTGQSPIGLGFDPLEDVTITVTADNHFAVYLGLADGTGLRQRLTDVAAAEDPSAPETLVRSGVRTTLLVVFGGQSLLALLLVVWGSLFLARRAWARWLLLLTGLAALGFVALAQEVVAGGRDVDRLAFLAEAGLLVLALVLLLSRPVRAWLRPDDR